MISTWLFFLNQIRKNKRVQQQTCWLFCWWVYIVLDLANMKSNRNKVTLRMGRNISEASFYFLWPAKEIKKMLVRFSNDIHKHNKWGLSLSHTHLNVASILWLVHTNTHIVNYVNGETAQQTMSMVKNEKTVAQSYKTGIKMMGACLRDW